MSELKWHTIYPCYINSEFTRDKGRRVSKAFTVENPKAEEIINVLAEAGFPAKFEKKQHPADFFVQERVKYTIP